MKWAGHTCLYICTWVLEAQQLFCERSANSDIPDIFCVPAVLGDLCACRILNLIKQVQIEPELPRYSSMVLVVMRKDSGVGELGSIQFRTGLHEEFFLENSREKINLAPPPQPQSFSSGLQLWHIMCWCDGFSRAADMQPTTSKIRKVDPNSKDVNQKAIRSDGIIGLSRWVSSKLNRE